MREGEVGRSGAFREGEVGPSRCVQVRSVGEIMRRPEPMRRSPRAQQGATHLLAQLASSRCFSCSSKRCTSNRDRSSSASNAAAPSSTESSGSMELWMVVGFTSSSLSSSSAPAASAASSADEVGGSVGLPPRSVLTRLGCGSDNQECGVRITW